MNLSKSSLIALTLIHSVIAVNSTKYIQSIPKFILLIRDYDPEYYKKYICKPTNGFNFDPRPPKGRKKYLDYCTEHAANTCCQYQEIKYI
jgi:hypothetical protein